MSLIPFFFLIVNNYNNSHIKRTEPSWNETITRVNKINLTFVHPSLLTENVNVSIYQRYENEYPLHQRYICARPNCLIEKNFTLSLMVESTTFNTPRATYHIEIDDDFIKYEKEFFL